MFDNVTLPDLEQVSRRTVYSAVGVGIIGLVVCVVLSAYLVGIGLCIGMGLGIVNFGMTQRSVARIGASAATNKRRPLATNTLGRLALLTVVALGLLFLSFDLGFGTMAGLAVFQLLLLVSVARSVLRGGGMAAFAAGALLGDDQDDGAPAVRVPDVPEAGDEP